MIELQGMMIVKREAIHSVDEYVCDETGGYEITVYLKCDGHICLFDHDAIRFMEQWNPWEE